MNHSSHSSLPPLDVISEIQLPIPRLHLPIILHLPACYLLLHPITSLNIYNLARNQELRDAERTERETVAKGVGSGTVNLTGYDASGIGH
jgi:hypothetical protein